MLVTMKETRLGSPDGIQVREYVAGETVDPGQSLAEVFLREGWAIPAEQAAPPGPAEVKPDGPAATKPARPPKRT